jgi:dipeptide/tripeptide permease
MTTAEIMFAISGISFAYSQAPESMKSVLQATWYFTMAIGNLIVVIVAEAKMVDNQVWEYIIFALLLGVATILFIALAYYYKYEENIDREKKNASNNEKIEIKSIKSNSIVPIDDNINTI